MASSAPPASAIGRASLWRHASFVKLWTAQTVSQLGTQVSLLAIPLVGAGLLRLDPFQFALLGTFEFLPFLLFSLPAGAVADRLPRRQMMVVADLGRAAVLAVIPLGYVFGQLSAIELYAVAFLTGTLTVFFEIAYLSYLPDLVVRDQIIDANAKLEISRSGSQIAGPGLAGVVIGVLSAPVAIVLDSLSFVASALIVLAIPRAGRPGAVSAQPGSRSSVGHEVREGLRFVLGHPYLRAIAACTGISNLFSNLVFAILILYFVRDLGFTPASIGAIFAVGNVGLLVGALSGARIGQRFGIGPAIIGAAILFGPSLGLLIALRSSAPLGIATTTAGLFLGSVSQVVYNINQVGLRQAVTPPEMLGRMNATMRFIVWGSIPIGQLLGGALGSTVGLYPAMVIGAVGGVVAFVPLLLSPLPRLRTLPSQ